MHCFKGFDSKFYKENKFIDWSDYSLSKSKEIFDERTEELNSGCKGTGLRAWKI